MDISVLKTLELSKFGKVVSKVIFNVLAVWKLCPSPVWHGATSVLWRRSREGRRRGATSVLQAGRAGGVHWLLASPQEGPPWDIRALEAKATRCSTLCAS